MEYQLTIDREQRVALLNFAGPVSGTELAKATKALYDDPNWDSGFDAIWDFRRITELLLEKDDIQSLIEVDRQYANTAAGGRDIFIVSRQLDYVMGKIHGKFAEQGPRESQVCRSLDEAWEALGRGKVEN